MSDLRTLLRAAAAARRAGRPLLVATVVGVRGSSYRRAGARMILDQERWLAGSVSGGCLEADLVRRGWWLLRDGAAALLTYDSSDDDGTSSFGLGCGGVIDILLQRLEPDDPVDPFRFMESCVEAQRPGVIATVVQSDDERVPLGSRVQVRENAVPASGIDDRKLLDGVLRDVGDVLRAGQPVVATYATCGGRVRVLLEPVLPPARLFVLGTGHDAVPVVTQARAVGWEVLVWADSGRFSAHERFAAADAVLLGDPSALLEQIDRSARSACVVMSHHYERDRSALRSALASRTLYVGVLGPRRRTGKILDDLGLKGAWDDPRLHAPVGLELGAESPAEIALSIVAEVQSVLTCAAATSLRDRSSPIHVGLAS